MKNNPIGIFDSGIGGLTVAQSVVKQLPYENIIYFGDTTHMPYGDKSVAAIQAYAIKITEMLLEKKCKMILIACNTASAAAYELVKEYVGHKAVVLDVINPVISHVQKNYAKKCVGLIGTRAMVNTHVYQKKMAAFNNGIILKAQATPILASIIEEGFRSHKVIGSVLEEYLSRDTLSNIDALILACTHYPVIKKNIAEFYNDKIDLIDPSDIVADALHAQLKSAKLLNDATANGQHQFYLSDFTQSFSDHAKLFFGEKIEIKQYGLWD